MSKIKTHNIFKDIPNHLENELFTLLLHTDNIKIERIVSKGHSSPQSDWYDQVQNEWIIVLAGEAIIHFKTEPPVHLHVGDHLIIPAHTLHQIKWTHPDIETVWLAVHY